MSNENDKPQDVTSPPEAPVQDDAAPDQDPDLGVSVLQPPGKTDEDRESFEWIFTQGEATIRLSYFLIEKAPDTLDEEQDPQGKLILALISEVLRLSKDVEDCKEAIKYLSLQDHLSGQGKRVRGRRF